MYIQQEVIVHCLSSFCKCMQDSTLLNICLAKIWLKNASQLCSTPKTYPPYAHVFASVTHPYQGHDTTSCCWLVVMDSERFASPIKGIFCGGLNAYCMHIRPLFLRTSGSSGVLKALLLERNGQLSCNPKKKKKKKKTYPKIGYISAL